MIKFIKTHKKVSVKNNAENKIIHQTLEYRTHPLTKQVIRINTSRAKRPMHNEYFDLSIFEENENCLFCEPNRHKLAGFPDSKSIKKNEFYLFPNLYPFAKYHAVGILTDKHFVKIDEFKEKQFYDAFETSIKWIKKISKKDSKNYASSINMNYMFPAAASQIHPHIQITIDENNSNHVNTLIQNSKKYYHKHWTNYWSALIHTEKKLQERYIKSFGNIHIISSFAPVTNNEIQIILENKPTFFDLNKEDIRNLAEALIFILNKYGDLNYTSFNFSFFSPKKEKGLDQYYYLNGLIGTRSNVSKFYSTDKGFMEVLHQEPVISTLPESVKNYF